jgi:hypothetical protein
VTFTSRHSVVIAASRTRISAPEILVPKTELSPMFSNEKGTTSVVPMYANHKAALAAEASFETVAFQIAARDVLHHIFDFSESAALRG